MRRPETDAAGVKKQIQCGQGARNDCLWHGGKGGTREGFPDPDPPLGGILTPGASMFPLLPANQTPDQPPKNPHDCHIAMGGGGKNGLIPRTPLVQHLG